MTWGPTIGVQVKVLMSELNQVLRGAQHGVAPPLAPLHTLLVIGAGGTLGSAVLAEALVAGRFAKVWALVAEPLASALRGFAPLHSLQAGQDWAADTAVIVFERQRHSNGRDAAFVQPEPSALLPLAQTLHRQGVRRLLVLVPHAPSMLPQALSQGLASLDEAAVAALGFGHLVFLRSAQNAPASRSRGIQRIADWWLSQLAWMVPQRQQSLRSAALARCVVELARQLPRARPGTRVIAPETLWLWSQNEAGLSAAVAQGLQAG
jgi:hypothetical protein